MLGELHELVVSGEKRVLGIVITAALSVEPSVVTVCVSYLLGLL
ncbi:MAG: hypothetical protein ACI4TL_05505 [Candidatus Cryptobacteroides sp.]